MEGEAHPPPPDENSVQIMNAVDQLPPVWRRLVYEYGFRIAFAMYEESTVQGATADLEMWRERCQEEWLETDYFPTRAAPKRSVMF